jgi:hypothetical protein
MVNIDLDMLHTPYYSLYLLDELTAHHKTDNASLIQVDFYETVIVAAPYWTLIARRLERVVIMTEWGASKGT